MRLLVTGATGFLGWRAATLLAARGHDVRAVTRPGAAARAHSAGLAAERVDVLDGHPRRVRAGRGARAGHGADVVPALGQQRRRPPAQEAGRARDEQPHGR